MRLKEFATVAGYKTIAARNAIANPDVIKPGQVLDVGDGVVLPKGTTYTVKPGDTLSGIAQKIRKGQVPDTASAVAKPMVTAGGLKAGPDRSDPVYDAPLSGGRTQAQSDALFKKQMQDVKNFFTGNNQSTSSAAAPVLDKTPATDAELKKIIGADQPIPTYKYDATKDQAILDKLQKQDREKQKQLQNVPKQKNNPPKPPPGTKTGSSEFDRIRDIESNNRDYDKQGRPIVSPKGARFAAQVLPTTSVKPGYGVKPAANASAEESNRVGRDYFAAMKNRYGDSQLAAAAYNAGPGRLDRILQRAKQTGRDWKTMLPRETQNYLEKFKGK